MMDKYREETERAAAGLRVMEKEPDGLLYCDDGDFFDKLSISGVPVFHSQLVFNAMTDWDIPFIPIWTAAGEYGQDRRRFDEAYIEAKVGE